MHFAKWMRKNSKKIMVFVVIFSMLSFVIGYTGLQLFFSIFSGDREVVGTYDGGKLRVREYRNAQDELRLLQMLGGDRVLLAQGQQGLAGPLMAYLLFPDSSFVGEVELPTGLKQAAQSGQIPVSVDLIEAFFAERLQPEVTWHLLKAEAANAGSRVSDAMARELLEQILPQLFQGFDAGQAINSIVAQTHVTESQLVRTFADLLGVLFYAGNVTDSQAVTLPQIQASIGRNQERFDAEFVRIPAAWFVDPNIIVEPGQLEMQFEAFKTVLPGTPTEDNPFGYGYKLPKRVQLEYMVVLLDDVRKQIERPSAEAMEDFYSRNIEAFRYQEPADPNDPEGQQVTKTRTFAESLPDIRSYLEQERVQRLANQIFNEARTLTERGFTAINVETADFDQLQAAAGDYDYEQAAATLSGRYNVPVQIGKTGTLSAADFAQDSILRGLRLPHGTTSVPLSDVVFAVQRDSKDMPRRIGVPTVRPWETIGPMAGQVSRLMAMVRVTEIYEQAVPETMDVAYSVAGMILPTVQPQDNEAKVSLAEQVAADVRLLKAMETAQEQAQRLASLVQEHGWDEGIEAFNAEFDAGEAEAALETVRGQTRISKADMEMMRRLMTTSPVNAAFIQVRLNEAGRNDMLYALLPDSEKTTGVIHEMLGVNKVQTAFVVRSVTRVPATEADYLENKVNTAFQLSMIDSAGLALRHLKPGNLFERMNYVSVQTPVVEVDEPALPPVEGF